MWNENIRKASEQDISRIAEIEIFNFRLNFYPIFKSDAFYFNELQVVKKVNKYQLDINLLNQIWVYDDGAVKGFIHIDGTEVKKLFVEPVLQGQHVGAKLLDFAIENYNVKWLWALEKNTKAIRFYERHGFWKTETKKFEEGTTEYLVMLSR